MQGIIEIFKEVHMMKGLEETLYMVGLSTFVSYLFGLPLGIVVAITDQNGLKPHPILYQILGWIINMTRSIPYIILLVVLIPFTLFLAGTSVGPQAVVVSLSIGAIPFVGRLVENSIKEIDRGVFEAAICMGASTWDIITKVFLVEAIPSLIRGVSLTMIMLIGYSAMAGAVGGGGLGDIAIRYGFYRFETDIMLVTLVVLILLVQVIQIIFEGIAKKINKR
ncbi:MAG: ABC transporter permease [Bacilli bacterium]|nr:ABC transporter permease [Bacilli bacterium]